MTCAKPQGFLAQQQLAPRRTEDARKVRYDAAGALALLEGVDRLVAAKGKRVVRVDLRRDAPSRDDLLALLLGPSGRLRAPTLRLGRTLIVGFDAEAYATLFR